ncbi:MAG: asparagine synthase (glutamine-hydrolyzing) [Flavobacteriales bacterium]
MCGINGIFGLKDKQTAEQKVNDMNRATRHRGPDNSAVFSDDYISLGHNRLSIIDIGSAANQPFVSSDGRYSLVFNGEIYNYREIRQQLSGWSFTTNSDTEVLLAAYIVHKENCLRLLNGMFAFAVWDSQDKTLFLARDRTGIKPLYYFDNQQILIFSSEIKGILASGLVNPRLNNDSIIDYFRYQTVHAPHTILDGVKLLPAGSYMLASPEEVKVKKYWSIVQNTRFNEVSSYRDACERNYELLKQAVKRRLVADVPFGAFLSGGIDSGAVVGLMSEVQSSIKTFNIAFEEEQFSEAVYARKIADKFSTQHTEIVLKASDLKNILPDALQFMDHPSADGPNTFLISKITKESGVTMALSGLGGDELYAGYGIFNRALKLQKTKWLFSFPRGIRNVLAKVNYSLKPGIASKKIQYILSQNYLEPEYYYPYSRLALFDDDIKNLTGKENLPVNRVFEKLQTEIGLGSAGITFPLISKISLAELETYLSHVLLRDTDQMSMAHALEVRVPFLDHELVEFVMGLPTEWKTPTTPKKFLIDSLGDLLPSEIVNRPKMGFTFPWEIWFKNDLKEFVQDNLQGIQQRGIIKSGAADELWKRFLNNDPTINWSRIWQLVVLENWLKNNNVSN